MHTWTMGTPEAFPGWWRVVPWAARAQAILRREFPPLLEAARGAGLRVFHVVSCGTSYKQRPGYVRARALAEKEPPRRVVAGDPVRDALQAFKREHAFPGLHNEADIARGFAAVDFPEEAAPRGDEGIAATSAELFALCQAHGVNHLVYAGFCLDGCLLVSPGGMADMTRRGLICSAVRQATTAIENKGTGRTQAAKELGLWRVAVCFGFVYDAADLIAGLRAHS